MTKARIYARTLITNFIFNITTKAGESAELMKVQC
jgi:hypothetical protein